MRIVMAMLLVLAAACESDMAEPPPPAAAPPPAQSGVTDHGVAEVADLVFEMTNEARKQSGLQALEPLPALSEAARKHSVEMAENRYLGHEALDGSTLRERLPADLQPRAVAENVWGGALPELDSVTLAKRIVAGWMESPGHRQNIESPDFVYLGVGVAKSGEEVRAVQIFASE
jgi:uncharacterized protein YkwD